MFTKGELRFKCDDSGIMNVGSGTTNGGLRITAGDVRNIHSNLVINNSVTGITNRTLMFTDLL